MATEESEYAEVYDEIDRHQHLVESANHVVEDECLQSEDIDETSTIVTISKQNVPSSAVSTTTPAEYVPQFHFSGTKAGMEAVDKTKLERIIAEVSKGNPYYEQAAKTDQRVLEKAKAMRKKAESLTAKELSVAEIEVGKRTRQLEAQARAAMNKVIVCIDMDQFFVAVEVRDDPRLKNLPLAVGTTLISTASYEARKFGVRSAMPTFIAKRLCPQLVTVPGRHAAYSEASKRAQSVFAEYDPSYAMMSLDECFLDISDLMNGLDLKTKDGEIRAKSIVEEIRAKVTIATGGLTCSAGVAPSRMLAKICSERNKPNGSFVLGASYEEVIAFARALPVRKIPGIGKASELLLDHAFDVKTVQNLFEKRFAISRCLTPAIIDFYLRVPLCATETDSTTNSDGAAKKVNTFFGFSGENTHLHAEDDDDEDLRRKSISMERTFRAIEDEESLLEKLRTLSQGLAEDLHEKRVRAHTFTLKLKTDKFEVRSRGESVKVAIGGLDVEATARGIFNTTLPILRHEMPVRIRLMGIRASNLIRCVASVAGTSSGAQNAQHITGASDHSFVKRQQALDEFCTTQKRLMETVEVDNDEEMKEPVATCEDSSACPVCGQGFARLRCTSNDDINAHVDACLNRGTVATLVAATHHDGTEENSAVAGDRKKLKTTIASFFGH